MENSLHLKFSEVQHANNNLKHEMKVKRPYATQDSTVIGQIY